MLPGSRLGRLIGPLAHTVYPVVSNMAHVGLHNRAKDTPTAESFTPRKLFDRNRWLILKCIPLFARLGLEPLFTTRSYDFTHE